MSSFRPRQFDLIAFDWDGTLFDSTAIITRCIQLAVQDVGGAVPSREQASYVIGMALMPALAHAAPDVPKDKYPLLGERYRHHYLAHQHDISLFDGVLNMLAELKSRHHWLTVATGKSRAGLNEALHAVELRDVFDGSRTTPARRPNGTAARASPSRRATAASAARSRSSGTRAVSMRRCPRRWATSPPSRRPQRPPEPVRRSRSARWIARRNSGCSSRARSSRSKT